VEAVALQAAQGRILRIEGVLNGTSNYVLERIMEGTSISEAVTQARRLGLAESDPTDDLEGLDTARKLAIVARLAFGVRLDPDAIPRQGIQALGVLEIRAGLRRGQRLRLLASCLSSDAGVEARVQPVWLDPDHPFANCRSDQNAVRIDCQDGTSAFVDGRGAGAWPTAESVVSDLQDLWRAHATRSGQGLLTLRAIDEEDDPSNDFERREQA
jgi:homoserine dehydrogenase